MKNTNKVFKRDLLRRVFKGIYGTSCICYVKNREDKTKRLKRNGKIVNIKFNYDCQKKVIELLKYTFKTTRPSYDDDEMIFDDLIVYRKALQWLSDFYNLNLDSGHMINRDHELKKWGNKLYHSYLIIMDFIFDNEENGENILIDINELQEVTREKIKELLASDYLEDE